MYSKWFRHPDGDLQTNRTSQHFEINQVFYQIPEMPTASRKVLEVFA